MKIGFDAKRAFLNSSGLGNYSRNTLNALQMYFNENEYVLFSPKIQNTFFNNYSDFETVTIKNPLVKKISSFWRSFFLVPVLEKHNLDIYHGLSNELPAKIKKSSIISVVTIHDLIFIRYPGLYKSIDRKMYFLKLKYACKAADKILAASNQTKIDIINFLDISPDKIEVIYQPVNPAFYEDQDKEAILKKYKIPEKFILAVGAIEPRKNHLPLIKGNFESGINMTLVAVGRTTSYLKELMRYTKISGIEDKIIFLQDLNVNELAALYQSATLSAYISKFEGFGLPVIEAMASKCPVLISSVSCLPETAGDAALLCDPENIQDIGSKISLILNSKSVREELIQKGINRASRFHPSIYAKQLTTLYLNLLKGKNG
ncbi:MAG: glycosyltransferase family 4 protein [Bacteroidales bacterium]|nr:glycosyltransferase family 4 protein [Bacteroidales bacterium]